MKRLLLLTLSASFLHAEESISPYTALAYGLVLLLLVIIGFILFSRFRKPVRKKRLTKVQASRSANPDLVEKYRINMQKIKIENQPFRLSGMLHILTNKISEVLKKSGHQLHYDVDSEVGRYIVGDNDYIEQVLEALMENVIGMNSNQEVILHVSKEKSQHIVFDVSNPTAILSKTELEAYTDANMADKDTDEALAAFIKARNIAEAMGGSLEVKSTKRTGTHFIFKIPYIEDKNNRSNQEKLKKFLAGKKALFIGKTKYETKRAQYIFDTFGIKIEHMSLNDFETKKPDLKRYDMAILRSAHLTPKHISFFKKIHQTSSKDFKIIIVHELFEDEKTINFSKPIADAELYNPTIIGDVEEILYQMFILKSKAVKGISNMDVFDPDAFIIKGNRDFTPEELGKFRGAHIAVAEDSKVDMRVLRNIFNTIEGIKLFTANNGIELMKLLEDEDIDIIFADINMPLLDGLTMTRRIRSESKWEKLPIISISSMAFKHEVRNMQLAGMNAAITKPITAQDVYMALDKFLVISSKIKERLVKCNNKELDYQCNSYILNVEKGIEDAGSPESYLELLQETLDLLQGSEEKFKELIKNEEYTALKEFSHSMLELYSNIHANEMVKMFEELTYYLSSRKKPYLMEYAMLYKKNLQRLQDEIDALEKHLHQEG